ncbi:hypothetical protein ACN08P_19015 [Photobacterium leiognathi subsp. mandapamensis]|uniref:hypothetical protein n=1 Tax=Photobacterium leiognathi TaxID=553611 RepID=UPI003AF39E50
MKSEVVTTADIAMQLKQGLVKIEEYSLDELSGIYNDMVKVVGGKITKRFPSKDVGRAKILSLLNDYLDQVEVVRKTHIFLPIESPTVHSYYQPLLPPFMPKNEVSHVTLDLTNTTQRKANTSKSTSRAPATEFSIDGGEFLPPSIVSKRSVWRGAKKVVVRGTVSEAKLRWLLKVADETTELMNLVDGIEVNLR